MFDCRRQSPIRSNNRYHVDGQHIFVTCFYFFPSVVEWCLVSNVCIFSRCDLIILSMLHIKIEEENPYSRGIWAALCIFIFELLSWIGSARVFYNKNFLDWDIFRTYFCIRSTASETASHFNTLWRYDCRVLVAIARRSSHFCLFSRNTEAKQ